MRIIIDGRWLGRTGIGRYVAELIDQLQQIDTRNEYVILLLPDYFDKWRPSAPNFTAVKTTSDVYTWQEQLFLPGQIRALQPDLVHFTSFNKPLAYRGRFVATIHDLTLVHFKNVRGGGIKKLVYDFKYGVMMHLLDSVSRRASAIIVPTHTVKDDVTITLDVADHRVAVTPEAVRASFAHPGDITRLGLGSSFILYVGNYYPYKNVGRLVEAFAKSQARLGGTKLVLNGKADYFQDQIRAQVQRLGLAQEVIFPGFTTDAELAALYRGADLFVFPSLSEGFGLPGLEAMAQGTPVLASLASCLPEVYGEAAAYFNPHDTDGLAREMDLLIGDPVRRENLSKAGKEHVTRFSWETMARQTLAVYEEAGRH